MSGSTRARLSAPASQMQLLYKLSETEVRAGARLQAVRAQQDPTLLGLLPQFSKGQTEAQRVQATCPWSPREFREAAGLSGDTSWLSLPKFKSGSATFLPV